MRGRMAGERGGSEREKRAGRRRVWGSASGAAWPCWASLEGPIGKARAWESPQQWRHGIRPVEHGEWDERVEEVSGSAR